MRIFVAGDTHGNTHWCTHYLYPMAAKAGADAIVVVGDFGLWEHAADGVAFLDDLAAAGLRYGIPLYALHGNHDNWSLVMARYGHQRTADGFVWMRPGVNYIPQGFAWRWAGVSLRSFGGAYSVDKDHRLRWEDANRKKIVKENGYRPGHLRRDPDTTGTLWFPDEEMTDEEMAALLDADSARKDIIFSHDKPRASNPGWNRKDLPLCWPNQDRLQLALTVHRPRLWVHGHLHYRYTDHVRHGPGSSAVTVVEGLAPDRDAVEHAGWRPTDSWLVIDTGDAGTFSVSHGGAVIDALHGAGPQTTKEAA
jgi:Icc-related predicted phosphoesterase